MTPTARQAAILAWLNRVSPHAARMFESALWIAADERIPCRGRMIAHAYREICSVLMDEYSSNSKEVLDAKLDDFVTEHRKLNRSSDAAASAYPTTDPGPTAVPEVYLRAADVVVRIRTTTDSARKRARAVFEGLSSRSGRAGDLEPSSDRWFRMQRSLHRWAHDRTTPDGEMMEGRFKDETEFFEESLSMFAASAVSNLDALDDILKDANS